MKKSRVSSWLVAAGMAVLLFSACSDKRRDDVIAPDKLESVLYDYHLAQVMISDLPTNQRYKKDLYFDYVYDKHGVTKAEIDSSLVYYARYPKDLADIYTNLSQRISADMQRLDGEIKPVKVREAVPVEGDSVDLWYDARIVEMTSSPLANNRYSFTVPTDSNFGAGDRLAWSGKAVFLQDGVDSLHRYLHLNLRVEYANDSIVSADTLLYASGDFTLEVSDTAVVKNINGAAYLKSCNADERLLLVVPSLVRCRRAELPDSLSVDTLTFNL